MKKGCLFGLAIFVGVSFFYWHLLHTTELADKWWIPLIAGVMAVGIAGNIYGIILGAIQLAASKRPISAWRDGSLVAISGRLSALRSPITAPFSGTAATIVSYDVKKQTHNDGSTNTTTEYNGFLMTPCSIQTSRGSMKLLGFPLLAQMNSTRVSDDGVWQRAATYMSQAQYKEMPSNPFKALAELNRILSEDDNDIREDLCIKSACAHVLDMDGDLDENVPPVEPKSETEKIEIIARQLQDREYVFEETAIKNGAVVTAFGTYEKNRQGVFIGDGVKNLKHQLHLGEMSRVVMKTTVRGILGTIFWGALFGNANWYLAKNLGVSMMDFLGVKF